MTSLSTYAVLLAMTACSVSGAHCFKQFFVAREPPWLVLGFVAYNLSNIAWIYLIGSTGLGRAAVYAAAANIVLLTLLASLMGETVGRAGWLAAGLACFAVVVASTAPKSPDPVQDWPAATTPSTTPQSPVTPAPSTRRPSQGVQ